MSTMQENRSQYLVMPQHFCLPYPTGILSANVTLWKMMVTGVTLVVYSIYFTLYIQKIIA